MIDKEASLKDLRIKMLADKNLPLKKGAANLVFGDGDTDTEVLFIGEGPGYWEDQKGIPFVGNAGKLLDFLLQSVELPRENVYITNVVHHRPPNNRDPSPEELGAYAKYLDKIIKIIDPRMIVTLGRFSMGKFLPNVYISSVHGKVHKISWKDKELIVLPMYHPAAGLRNGNIKVQLIEDFKKIPEVLSEIEQKQKEVKTEQMQLV